MKSRLIPTVLATALLLTGCSTGSATPEAQPETTPVSDPTPTVQPGSIAAEGLGAECVASQEPPVDFISFIGECGVYNAVEFDTLIYGNTIDKGSALEELSEMLGEAGWGTILVVDDDWAVTTKYGETAKQFLAENDDLDIHLPNGEPRMLSEQISTLKSAMKEVAGIDCTDKGKIDGSEITAVGCKKNGEYYAILGFFGSMSSLETALLEPKEMFRFAKRDTFIVNGSSWLIYDVPRSDAYQLQAILGGTVENLGEEPK